MIVNLLGIPKLSNLLMIALQVLIIFIYTDTQYDTLVGLGFQKPINENSALTKCIV